MKFFENKKRLYWAGGILVLGVLIVSATCLTMDPAYADIDKTASAQKDSNQADQTMDQEDKPSAEENNGSSVSEDEIAAMTDGSWWRNHETSSSSDSSSSEAQEKSNSISFPYQIPGSDLIVHRMRGYDGLYIENGEDEQVNGVAAVVIENSGAQDVEYAQITMESSQGPLQFVVTNLPAKEGVAVQEKNKALYEDSEITSVHVTSTDPAEMPLSEDKISIVETEDNGLTITNLTSKDISSVSVFYKFYSTEERAYLGGITYVSRLNDLKANGSVTIYPTHYETGGSRVVMADCTHDDA